MGKNEKTSEEMAKLAARLLRNPGDATQAEIRRLAGSVLTQVPDQPEPKPKPRKKP